MQLGLLTLLLGIVLIAGGTVISMLLDICVKLGLVPKAGYVLTCAIAYVAGSFAVVGGIMIVVYALANQG